MYIAVLWALAVATPPTLNIRAPAACSIEAGIEGFSANDVSVAVRERMACHHGKKTDKFTLIELFDIASGERRASFVASDIRRFDGRGRRVFDDVGQLVRANPAFAHARRDWSRWASHGQVGQHRYDFDETLVRFLFDESSDGSVDVRGKTAVLAGDGHGLVAATLVARLSDGRHVPIGHVQSSERNARVAVDVHYSASGHSVAIVAHSAGSWHVEAHRLPDNGIIGTHKLGLSNRMFDFSRNVGHDFAGAHPEAKDDWMVYVHTGI